MKIAIVDAGNCQLLFTSNDLPLHIGGTGGTFLGGGAGWGITSPQFWHEFKKPNRWYHLKWRQQ